MTQIYILIDLNSSSYLGYNDYTYIVCQKPKNFSVTMFIYNPFFLDLFLSGFKFKESHTNKKNIHIFTSEHFWMTSK